MNGYKYSLERWLDLVIYTVLGLTSWLVLKDCIDPLLIKVSEYYGSKNIYFSIVSSFLYIFIISSILYKLKCLNPSHNVKLYLKYPPLFISILIGSFIIFYFYIPDNTAVIDRIYINTICFTFISVGMGVSFLFFSLLEKRKVQRFDKLSIFDEADNSVDSSSLNEWAKKETPIINVESDYFNHKIHVDRISELFLNQDTIPTIGLIGPFGSGKTGILNLVEKQLQKPRLLTCKIEGWGRNNDSIARIILTYVVEEISKILDCSSILSLPKDYYNAFKSFRGHGWSFGVIASELLGENKDPIELLARLDGILKSIDTKLIILLEDMDRHDSGNNTKEQLSAFLDRIRKLDNIGFILAVGTQQGWSEILIRICDYHEAIPINQDFTNILRDIRKLLIGKTNSAISLIDEIDINYNIHLTDHMTNEDHISILSNMISTPRELKQIIRKCLKIWDKLSGEMNLDDMLILTSIRFTQPQIFEYLVDNHYKLKTIRSGFSNETMEQIISEIFKKIDNICVTNGFNPNITSKIIKILFPGLGRHGTRTSGTKDRFQIVGKPTHTDYFIRYLREQLADNEIEDQSILKAINDYKSENQENKKCLIKYLMNDENYLLKFRDLSPAIFLSDDYRKLASSIISGVCNELTTGRILDTNVLSEKSYLKVSIDFIKKNPISTELHFDWLLKEINKVMPLSLSLVNLLYNELRDSGHMRREKSATILSLRSLIIKKSQIGI